MTTSLANKIETWAEFEELVRTSSSHLPQDYQKRIEFELYELNKQGLNGLWLEYIATDAKFDSNPNNLLIPWVLQMLTDMTDPMTLRTSPCLVSTSYDEVAAYVEEHGEPPHDFLKDSDVPDIDIDCLPAARDPIKDYAIRRYGDGDSLSDLQVCSVGTWQTYKFKMAIQDAATALGYMHRKEAEKLTSNLPEDLDNLKPGGFATCKGIITNDAGEHKECGHKHYKYQCPKCGSEITDAPTLERLLKENEELNKFAIQYPSVIAYAAKMVGRIRNMGMHAGALIIANSKLLGNIPLGKNKADGPWVSMWSEGSNQQLSKCGYIKWDILGLKTLEYIYDCCRMIRVNRGISFGIPQEIEGYGGCYELSGLDEVDPEAGYCGKFYGPDGVEHEIRYNDSHTYKLINTQRTDTIFQFDTSLAKSILADASEGDGVSDPHQLTLLNALGHPGPMQSIPKILANRDDPSQSWKEELKSRSPIMYDILKTTYGHVCFHETTKITKSNGQECYITDIKAGDTVFSVDEDRNININEVECCGPTYFGDGLCITLSNGYKFIVTDNHDVPTYDGVLDACDLRVGDLLGVPKSLSVDVDKKFENCVDWLGDPEDAAYLIGFLVGDGSLSGSGVSICCGNDPNITNILEDFISKSFKPINIHKYWHCRSWYLQLSTGVKKEKNFDIRTFVDNMDWWQEAYSSYSGQDISEFIGKSAWWTYKRIRELGIDVTGSSKNPWKSKFIDTIDYLGLRCSVYHKRIPHQILSASRQIRQYFLAGLIESDGHLSENDESCYVSSINDDLLDDIRCLCTSLGIGTHFSEHHRIYIWDTKELESAINDKLLFKSFNKSLTSGSHSYYVSKYEFHRLFKDSGLSQRKFACVYGIARSHFRNNSSLISKNVADKIGVSTGDLNYVKVTRIDRVTGQYFWNLSVKNDHSVIANGVYLKQCYQEQLTALWQRLAGFSATEAQAARKDIAKKKIHKLPAIKEKWVRGATKTLGADFANDYWSVLETFGRYAFNRSHGVAYAAIIAYRCTWFKAHFFPEWIASVLSTCDPKKAPRYISMARAEGWRPTDITNIGRPPAEGYEKFDIIPVDINNLSPNFSVIGNVVSVGMLSIKGIGESDRAVAEMDAHFESLDDFVAKTNAGKTLVERLIRLGAFEKIPGHSNSRALWYYYSYTHKKLSTAERRELYPKLLQASGWTPEKIEDERDRQVDAYRELYPKKKEQNYPKKVTEWMPADKHDLSTFCEMFEDYKIAEIITFEDEYLGYHLSNPLLMYDTRANRDIDGCIEDCMVNKPAFLECIIVEVNRGATQKGDPYCRLNVADGRQTTTVFIWSNNLDRINPALLRKGVAVMIPVGYQPKRKSFTMLKDNVIIPLNRKD